MRRRSPTFTSQPEVPAPSQECPSCYHHLTYQETVIGGVKPIERWDYYECRHCSQRFQYRHRTSRLTVVRKEWLKDRRG